MVLKINFLNNSLTYLRLFNRVSRYFYVKGQGLSVSHNALSDKVPDSAIPKPAGTDFNSAIRQPENGTIYDKKPFRMTLEKGRRYAWCLCGKSKSQPLCDGTHKLVVLKIKQKPINFTVEETKEYWLCNCKQTTHRPFCDGTHKEERIQTAVK